MSDVRKLVLPVAGLGKRLRPLTLHRPKALVELNGVPMLDYFIAEGLQSGIHEFILIINPSHKRHFDAYVSRSRKRFPGTKFHIRIQETPGGNGHALIQAADLVEKEPFAVRFCDDIIVGREPVVRSLIKIFEKRHGSVMLLERVPKSEVSRYGVVKVTPAGKAEGGKLFRVSDIVEKPKASSAPSNLIIIGGYVLTPEVMRNLKKIVNSLPIVAADALPLAIGLQMEIIVGGDMFGWEFPGKRLDCGTIESLARAEKFVRRHKITLS